MAKELTLKQFDDFMALLKKYDINYMHSDDGRVYKKGKALALKLDELCKNIELKKLYDLWEGDALKKTKNGAHELALIRRTLTAEYSVVQDSREMSMC